MPNLGHERIVINGIIFDRKTDDEMSKIFDNIETKFEAGLHAILTNAGVERADFCVGYFNLRGWKQVAADKLLGGDR